MANEAQSSQAHRAELDFDINGLKEKIETLDQGEVDIVRHEWSHLDISIYRNK